MEMMFKTELPDVASALPGRDVAMPVSDRHAVFGRPLSPPYPETMQTAMFGMGCFWGVERLFWRLPGVYTTAVGYAAGVTPNPTYQEVCSGQTGHNEVVFVVFDPAQIQYPQLLSVFWENHNPTQGMRQGNDIGTQYRSAIYPNSQEDIDIALETQSEYQTLLTEAGKGKITTEIRLDLQFYYAEEDHQQYLYKNPNGYCGLAGCGVSF